MLTRALRWVVLPACIFLALAAAQTTEETDPSELLPETQNSIHTKGYAGMVWWIPVEFWERAFLQQGVTADRAAEQLKPLRDYVMVAVVVGKIGTFGAINFAPADQVRAKTVLRGANGVSYAPVTRVSSDAESLTAIMKPLFANALGKMGESIELLFFPAKDAAGQLLADPRQKGSFAIILKELAGSPESVFEWQLPLTALSPPKFCPVGKERVKANWNYCPWHGVPLNEPATRPDPKPAK